MQETARRAHRELVRLAHRGLDLHTFLDRAEEQLRRVVDFHGAACFFTIDPSTMLLTGHINRDLSEDDEKRRAVNLGLAENEYRQQDFNKFAVLACGEPAAATLDEATNGRPQRSPRYRQLMKPFGLGAELRAAFVADGACWGGAALFRSEGDPGFDPRHGRFLEAVAPHLGEAIRTALVLRETEHPDPGAGHGPGLILLDEQGRVEALSPTATYWLEQLIDPGRPTGGALPEVIYGVAEQARLAAGTEAHGPMRIRVPIRSGGWLILHGTQLEGARSGSAVIIEPARRPDIAPLLLAAYGLSEREQTVTLCVLQGLSTAQIADRLFISPYTVQDHLKAVFEKVGVRSRKALVARVFFDHYFPGMQEQRPLGSSEWTAQSGA